MNIAAIVLAAGSSQRLGRPKQTVEIGGETLLRRAVRVARQADLRPVFVVLDATGSFVGTLRESGSTIVLNREAEEGMASSIRAAVRAAKAIPNLAGAVVMTCDQIGATAEHLQAICAEPERITGSCYSGRIAVPAYFPRSAFEQLLGLVGDAGGRELLRGAHCVRMETLALDIDTPEDIAQAEALYGNGKAG